MMAEAEDTRNETSPHLREFLAHAYVRRGQAQLVFAAILALALLAGALFPPRYTATATLAVLPSPEFTVREAAGSHGSSSSAFALDQIMKSESEILGSDALHDATLNAIGLERLYPDLAVHDRNWAGSILHGLTSVLLAPWRSPGADADLLRRSRALEKFGRHLRVLPAKDSNVITVTFTHRDAAMAAHAINTMLARYAERRSHLYRDPQWEVVRAQTESLGRAARDADAAMESFKAAHAISDYAAERELRLHRQNDLLADQARVEAERSGTMARLRALGEQISRLPQDVGVYRERDPDTRVLAEDAALNDLRGKLAMLRVHYKEGSRAVTALRAQISAEEGDRARLMAAPDASSVRTGRSPALDPLLIDRAHAEADLAAAAARALVLAQESERVAQSLAELESQETELAELARRKSSAEDAFTAASRVMAEQHMIEAEDALRLANVRVIEPARIPVSPAPLPLLAALAGVILGAGCAIATLVAGYLRRQTFVTAEGLEAATGIPVLGLFPAAEYAFG